MTIMQRPGLSRHPIKQVDLFGINAEDLARRLDTLERALEQRKGAILDVKTTSGPGSAHHASVLYQLQPLGHGLP